MLTKDTIGNFIGGVSQQPDKLMYPNQSKQIVNYQLSPSVGMKDRPPTEHITKLVDVANIPTKTDGDEDEGEEEVTSYIHPLCHTIIKEDGDYEVILTGNDVKVFDLDGNERGVSVQLFTNGTQQQTYTGNFALVNRSWIGSKKSKAKSAKYIYTIGSYTVYFIGSFKYNSKKKTTTWDELKEDYKVYTDSDCTQLLGYIQTISGQSATIFLYDAETEVYDPLNYIKSGDPLKELATTTIGDYTFITNRTVKTQLLSAKTDTTYSHSALIFVKQGNYTADYKIKINGVERATYTTTTNSESAKTNVIAADLYNDLVTSLGTTDWAITKEGSVICLRRLDNTEFTIQTEDSNANRDLYSFYKTAEDLSLLPTVAPDGFVLKIIGENINIADDYYLKFETSDGSAFGTGSWQETCSPDMQYKIDPTTMPVALVRNPDDTFTLKIIDWADRGAGDEDSAPTPSFIGNTIQDIFSHKGRLAMLSMDKVIFSDTEDIFSFFKQTTLTELETDPIDISSNAKQVLLKHSLPYNEALLLFSENSEFTIRGGDVFSNNTVACDLTMEYPCSQWCRPINAGNTGFFVFENGEHSRVMELYITQSYTTDARDITEQAPSYLPKNIYKIAGSTANNMACFLSTETTDKVYVYNYYYSSENKAQSAWSEWKFENTKVLNVDFKENFLYLVMQYSDGIYLERMDFTQQKHENNLDYLFYLDRKVYYEDLEPSNGTTIITLPYTPDNTITILDIHGFPLDYTINGTTVTINGEFEKVTVGNSFTSVWVLPLMFVREETSSGGLKVKEGLLMLRDINLTYADTGYFSVNVQSKYTTTTTSNFNFGTIKLIQEGIGESSDFEFTGKIAGTASATLGQINVSSGTFLIPIISKNDEIVITITNDSYMPSCFLSLEWLGDFVVRGQKS